MILSLRIALRYLLSRKSHGAVNLISAVSLAGVAVAAAAMVVVLSVFNGFSALVDSKTSNFNPPLMVVRADGRPIADADSLALLLGANAGIALASPIIDEQAFAVAPAGQMPVHIRAMAPDALEASGLQNIVIDGTMRPDAALLSVGVAMSLNLRPDGASGVNIFMPRRLGRVNPANPTTSFRGDSLAVAGIYQVEQEEQDRDMIVMPLESARYLLDYSTEASSVALYPAVGADQSALAKEITKSLNASPGSASSPADDSPGYLVLDRRQQEAEAFRMIAVEKWITFLMLLFILAIASFNIISTLSLMIEEKRANMGVLTAMGARPSLLRRIFASQGWQITIVGGVAGLVVGSLLVVGQMHFGWIKLSSQNPAMMAVDYYPVALEATDLLYCLGALIVTSLLIALAGALLVRRQSGSR